MNDQESFERLVTDMDNRFEMTDGQLIDALRFAVMQERKRRQSRSYANKIVRDFEAFVYEDAMAGSGHPDLFDWHEERLTIARERLICRLMGRPLPKLRMPPEPEVDY